MDMSSADGEALCRELKEAVARLKDRIAVAWKEGRISDEDARTAISSLNSVMEMLAKSIPCSLTPEDLSPTDEDMDEASEARKLLSAG